MKALSQQHKETILNFGYPKEDLKQIEKALSKTDFELFGDNLPEEKISKEKALEIIGEEEFLSGICRSAFHWSAVRENKGNGLKVYFNSSRLFQN